MDQSDSTPGTIHWSHTVPGVIHEQKQRVSLEHYMSKAKQQKQHKNLNTNL